MSFCPNCGKPVTEQASKCLGCGIELESRSKGRFKGTMMMQQGGVPMGIGGPPPQPLPESVVPPAPAPAPVPAPAAAAAHAPSKVAKHTMIGAAGMGMGLAPPFAKPASAAAAAPFAPPPAAGPNSVPPQAPQHDPLADTARENVAVASSPRNPAPAPAPMYGGPPPQYESSVPRLDQPHSDAPQLVPGQRGGAMVALGIAGLMLIAAIGYMVARFMGFIN